MAWFVPCWTWYTERSTACRIVNAIHVFTHLRSTDHNSICVPGTTVNCCEHTAQTSLSNPIRHQNRWREFGRYLEQNILETQQRWQPISHLIYSNLAFVQHSSENVCPLEPEFTESNSFIWLVSKRYSGAVCCLIKENRLCVFFPVRNVWLWIAWTSHCSPKQNSECFLCASVTTTLPPLCHWVKGLLNIGTCRTRLAHLS